MTLFPVDFRAPVPPSLLVFIERHRFFSEKTGGRDKTTGGGLNTRHTLLSCLPPSVVWTGVLSSRLDSDCKSL